VDSQEPKALWPQNIRKSPGSRGRWRVFAWEPGTDARFLAFYLRRQNRETHPKAGKNYLKATDLHTAPTWGMRSPRATILSSRVYNFAKDGCQVSRTDRMETDYFIPLSGRFRCWPQTVQPLKFKTPSEPSAIQYSLKESALNIKSAPEGVPNGRHESNEVSPENSLSRHSTGLASSGSFRQPHDSRCSASVRMKGLEGVGGSGEILGRANLLKPARNWDECDEVR
jgi:hypothetical protein